MNRLVAAFLAAILLLSQVCQGENNETVARTENVFKCSEFFTNSSRSVYRVIDLDTFADGFLELGTWERGSDDSGSLTPAVECTWLLDLSKADPEFGVRVEFDEFAIPTGEGSAPKLCKDNYVQLWYASSEEGSADQLLAAHCGDGDIDAFQGASGKSLLVKAKITNSKPEIKLRLHFSTVANAKSIGMATVCPADTHFVCFVNGQSSCLPKQNWCDLVVHCDNMDDEVKCQETQTIGSFFTSKAGEERISVQRQNYSQTDSGCGSPRFQTGTSGSFQSAGYPNGYTPNLHCLWYIMAPPGSKILIKFNRIVSIASLDSSGSSCGGDSLSLFNFRKNNEAQLLRKFCGSKSYPLTLVPSNIVAISFDSDERRASGTTPAVGFQIYWKSVGDEFVKKIEQAKIRKVGAGTGQGAETGTDDAMAKFGEIRPPQPDTACSSSGATLRGRSGIIREPAGSIQPRLQCEWRIEPDIPLNPGQHWLVTLKFTKFDVGKEGDGGMNACKTSTRLEVANIDLQKRSRRGYYCNAHKAPMAPTTLDNPTKQSVTIKFVSEEEEGTKTAADFLIMYTVTVEADKPGTTTTTTTNQQPSCGRSPAKGGAQRQLADGSTLALPGAWPWLVQLTYDGQHACVATIVNQLWLVTSASCFKDRRVASRWQAIAGRQSLTVNVAWDQTSPLMLLPIKRILVHRQYSQSSAPEFNIAMIQLKAPLTSSPLIGFACMPSRDITETEKCFTADFGGFADGAGGLLRQIKQTTIGLEKCKAQSLFYQSYATPKTICATVVGFEGPLVCAVGGRWQLHGVSSFSSAGLYTRVYRHLDWIQQTIKGFSFRSSFDEPDELFH